jgi:hypothetical protein
VSFYISEPLRAHLRRWWKRRELLPVVIRSSLTSARLVAVIVVKNEARRMPALLRHYRQLGVEHFIVIDNQSTDALREGITRDDVSLYSAVGDYSSARYGIDWVNTVLSRHCHGKWILHVDADEFLVFDSALSNLDEVCSWLDSSDRPSLQALMLDMYSDRRATDNVVREGQDPVEVCNLFDRTGYERRYDAVSGTMWVKGGVRGRLFFPDRWEGPALNKTPLVRWNRHHAFLRSAHLLWPRPLNGDGRTPELCLLHFKFTESASALMGDEIHRAQHTSEYLAYDGAHEVTMVGAETVRYSRPADITKYGLLARTGPTL